MGRGGLKFELWRCFWILSTSLLVGLFTRSVAEVFAVVVFIYLVWLFLKIDKLEAWVNQVRRSSSPEKEDLKGLWQDVAYDVQLLIARHEKEKQRLNTVVNRVQDMTSALTDAVILIDVKGNMEWWNTAAQRLFNFRPVDHGHKLTNLIRHPKFVKYFEGKQYALPLELNLWRNDQYIEFQVHTFGQGERLVIVRDITRLYKLEQMRKDFVANVSHELRTPLTVIRGYLETLADAPNVPAPWIKAVGQMEQQSKRMTLLINDLITLTKLETDQKDETDEPVDIARLMDEIVVDAEAISPEHQHRFDVSGDPTLGILGNERELRSALSNLVVNAVNYSEQGGEVRIRYESSSQGAVISISDNGIGIDPKHIPRLTERFYRVDTSRSVASGGTGLGLAIVKHVLLKHNAELRITSQIGKGSTFSCLFPTAVTRKLSNAQLKNVLK